MYKATMLTKDLVAASSKPLLLSILAGGESYGYERGEHATISFTWTDASQTLSIGARSGSFPGMVRERTFNIVLVGKGHGVGEAPVVSADRVVRYNGEAISVNFKSTR